VVLTRGYGRANTTLTWVRRHSLVVQRVGGVMMVIVGLGYVLGFWSSIFQPLQRWFSRTGWPPI